MPLKPYFSNCIRQLGYTLDPHQVAAVDSLEDLFQALCEPVNQKHPSGAILNQWLSRKRKSQSPSVSAHTKGRYLWGGIGRGKTWIMDLFFHSLPLEAKLRQHFQHFMKLVHGELTALKGNRDPLKIVAQKLASQYRIICLDEFHVNDITDAMLLHGLLNALFDQGMVLVVTSNLHPDELYLNGLQRERFLPAIALIKQHTELVEFSGAQDYRLRPLQQAGVYYTAGDAHGRQGFQMLFNQMALDRQQTSDVLQINRRPIAIRSYTKELAWFDFYELCATARSALDYIEIASRFHTVFLEGIPVMSDNEDDQARRFVHLVDEFYDRKIRLLIYADAPVQDLYHGRRLKTEFERTVSRLLEMRTQEYQERCRAARTDSGADSSFDDLGSECVASHGLKLADQCDDSNNNNSESGADRVVGD